MLCTQGGERDVVKVLDFGLVKDIAVDREVKLTGQSAVLGTPQYMAPKSILEPQVVDVRTDIYALGLVASRSSRTAALKPRPSCASRSKPAGSGRGIAPARGRGGLPTNPFSKRTRFRARAPPARLS